MNTIIYQYICVSLAIYNMYIHIYIYMQSMRHLGCRAHITCHGMPRHGMPCHSMACHTIALPCDGIRSCRFQCIVTYFHRHCRLLPSIVHGQENKGRQRHTEQDKETLYEKASSVLCLLVVLCCACCAFLAGLRCAVMCAFACLLACLALYASVKHP